MKIKEFYILYYLFYFCIFYLPIYFNIYWPDIFYDGLNVLIVISLFMLCIICKKDIAFFRNVNILVSFFMGIQFNYILYYILYSKNVFNWYV